MADLRFYNTLGRRFESFEPIEPGHVRIYSCGPTVYAEPHIGNLRTFLFEDVLCRTLRWFGYRVTQAMNLTDVEDKIIARSAELGQSIGEFTQPFIEAFYRDLDWLGVERAQHYPRATEYVPQMIAMIERLVEQGNAYVSEGSVFFRIATYADYGRLSGIDLSQVRRGDRVAEDEYGKDDARDFVLWKATKPGEPAWESPWGPGRPGWHIECSTMSAVLLGDTFDIHCGGVDNIFPHHENEIAQSVCALGTPFVRYWLHSEHLLVDGEKMSKSLGNQYTLQELFERCVSPRVLRYLFVSVHYRQKLSFSSETAEQAAAALRRVDEMLARVEEAETLTTEPAGRDLPARSREAREGVAAALADDLNVSGALGEVFAFVREVNRYCEAGLSGAEKVAVRELLRDLDRVFGVFDAGAWSSRVPQEMLTTALCEEQVEVMIAARAQARASRDFERADRIRDQLKQAGIELEDTARGTRWRRG